MTELTEKKKQEVIIKAHDIFMQGYQSTPSVDQQFYIEAMATLAISLLHGATSIEFMNGFLDEARETINDPNEVVLTIKKHSLN